MYNAYLIMFMSAVSERIPKILEYIGFFKKKNI